MNIYTFHTTLDTPQGPSPWSTVCLAQNEVTAIAAAHTWVLKLAETVSGVLHTEVATVDIDGRLKYHVGVDHAVYATASVDGFGHVNLDNNEKGGLCIASMHVDVEDRSISLPYVNKPEFAQAQNF